MVWGKGKPKGRSGAGDEFKNILIPSNCSYLKTPYLHLKIYSKLYDTATNWDKGAQREKGRMSRPQFLWFKVWSISGRLKRKRKKSCQNYVIFHHCCISRLGCKMFCLPKHKGKENMIYVQRKHFRCYFSCPSTENRLFDEPTITKMRQNLKHSVEKRQ